MDTSAPTHPGAAGRATKSPRAEGGRRKPAVFRRGKMSEAVAAYVLLAPVLVLFAFAVVYPLVDTIRLSFFDIKGLGAAKFNGFGNYVTLFYDATFRQSVVTTLTWTILTTILSVGIGWALAILCSFSPRATLVPRVLIFAAYGISEAVTGFIWLGIY
ncbi:MAG: putative transrane component of transporter, partial [Hyphomicrobiales bacterium]|nr:putative transrane component of transporter [Hyphomicrobiales bacterium]